MMDSSRRTRDMFLYLMAVIYMFAFGSWFIQVPGLYGDNGLLPIKNVLANTKNQPLENLFLEKPTIIWIFLYNGLSHQTSIELLCLLGVALSFLCLLFKSARCMLMFFFLRFLYYSLYQVGQTFSWFQWDILLLEAGFLTALVAPVVPGGRNSPLQRLPFFLVKWLLFRLMFASGVVKLSSQCPTWWGLTAMNYHFETQCIPTPLAWWSHQFPKWFLKLSVIGTYVIEIGLPFLFFAPVRRLRYIGVYAQILLMFVITLTGNYNFFNLLTVALCLSTMDDKHLAVFGLTTGKRRDRQFGTVNFRKFQRILTFLATLIVCAGYAYHIVNIFGLKFFKSGDFVYSKTEFSREEYRNWVDEWTVTSIWIGAICFIWESLYTLYLYLQNRSLLEKLWSLFKYVSVLSLCVYLFCISMVPFKTITSDRTCWPIIHKWHASTYKQELVHSYGLFRRMTGVGGRPEVILQGSHSESGPWKEIEFPYKPGNTSRSLPWIVPHQPRLDWQMWFAALGQYQENAWFVSLVDKIMNGNADVLKLLDEDSYPFKDVPPKYMKADLFLYHFTLITKNGGLPKRIWSRKFDKGYLPTVNKNHPDFKRFLKYHNLETKKIKKASTPGYIEDTILTIRRYFETIPIHILLWSLWLTAIVIVISRKIVTNTLNK